MNTENTQELENVLLLIEEAHKATSPKELRQSVVYGVGTLIESVSCVWTELNTDLFKEEVATTTAVNINIDEIDVDEAIMIFNQHAWQHPVVAHCINTESPLARSMSDFLSQSEFKNLDLYRYFYAMQSIEDQLSVGYVENGNVKGLSVNRATWGFTKNERKLLEHVSACVFPFYKELQGRTPNKTPQEPLIEVSINTIATYYDVIGVTARQAELLTLVAQGKSNKQIAFASNISEGTVRKHLENAFNKLDVNNRVSAIIKCIKIIQRLNASQNKPLQ